ncbi:MAG: hypothetical protein ACK58T_09545, partial [Phycisphaerae bacterium]
RRRGLGVNGGRKSGDHGDGSEAGDRFQRWAPWKCQRSAEGNASGLWHSIFDAPNGCVFPDGARQTVGFGLGSGAFGGRANGLLALHL